MPQPHTWVVGEVDGRRVRGDRTRHRAAICAAQLATVAGLESITVSRLAVETGLSKSGILTVFPNRVAIQLAAIAAAREVFADAVVLPALDQTPGRRRLRAVIDNWFTYVQRRVFPGGCFFVAVANEYGAQEGEVADVVRETNARWRSFIEAELMTGQPRTAAARRDARRDAFRLDAYMTSANTRYAQNNDEAGLEMARQVCHELLRQRSQPAGTRSQRAQPSSPG